MCTAWLAKARWDYDFRRGETPYLAGYSYLTVSNHTAHRVRFHYSYYSTAKFMVTTITTVKYEQWISVRVYVGAYYRSNYAVHCFSFSGNEAMDEVRADVACLRSGKLMLTELRALVDILRLNWVREHLLEPAPEREAAILLSPLQRMHSMSFEVDCESLPVNPRHLTVQTLCHMESVLVPAYSCDGYTAGYVVENVEGIYDPTNELFTSGRCFVPFVMSESDGTAVFQNKKNLHSGSVILSVIVARGRAQRCGIFGFEERNLFTLLDSHVTDLHAYEHAISSLIVMDGICICRICKATCDVMCSCSTQYIRARNSLDFSAVTHNLLNLFSSSRFHGSYQRFINGRSENVMNLSSSFKSIRVAKQSSAPILLDWAISRALKTQPQSIDRLLCSSLDVGNPDAQPFCFSDVSKLLQQPPTKSEPDLSDTTLTVDEIRTDGLMPVSVWSAQQSVLTSAGGADTWDPFSDVWADPLPLDTSTLAVTSVECSVVPPPKSPLLTTSSASIRIATRSSAVPIAPGTLRLPRVNEAARVAREEEVRKTTEEMRAWKAYQRKIRNRESAARSNLARKQRRLGFSKQKQEKKQKPEHRDAPAVHFGSAVS